MTTGPSPSRFDFAYPDRHKQPRKRVVSRPIKQPAPERMTYLREPAAYDVEPCMADPSLIGIGPFGWAMVVIVAAVYLPIALGFMIWDRLKWK